MSVGYLVEYWPGTNLVKQIQYGDESELQEGWVFIPNDDGPPPDPVPSPEQQEAIANTLLDSKLRQANAQVTALQGRVDAINDAIEFEEALPEEIAELPIRKAQLTLWKKYRIELGRVKTAPGWYQTPAWPTMPEPYTSETAARPVQAS